MPSSAIVDDDHALTTFAHSNPLQAAAPSDNIVCKCEKVTEAEVVAACHRALPIDSTQAIRKRTRAGMGSCQGKGTSTVFATHPVSLSFQSLNCVLDAAGAPCDGYDCERRVAAIIARETGLPVAAVGRRPWPATSTLPKVNCAKRVWQCSMLRASLILWQRWLGPEDKEKLKTLALQSA